MAWANLDRLTPANLTNKENITVFNVKDEDFGAAGDGTTDDTSAITGAIAAAILGGATKSGGTTGGTVFLPTGIYLVTADIDVPEGITLQGAGPVSSIISWDGSNSSNPTNAVITSNLTGQWTWATGARIKDLQVQTSKASFGMILRGWNELCSMKDVQIRSATSICLVIESVETGSTISRPTHQANFKGLQILPVGGATGIELNAVRRCTFDNITIDETGGGTTPITDGIVLARDVEQCTFNNIHFEDCTRGFDIGRDAANTNNTFTSINADVTQASVTPADTTNGGVTGSMAFRIRSSGMADYNISSLRDTYGYDYVLHDAQSNFSIAGQGSGGGATNVGTVLRGINTPLEITNGDVRLDNTQAYRVKTFGGANASTAQVDTSDNLIIGDTSLDDIRFNLGGLASAVHIREQTGIVDMSAATMRLRGTHTPASGTDTGVQGDIAWDASSSSYIYVCGSTNSWMRVALSPF